MSILTQPEQLRRAACSRNNVNYWSLCVWGGDTCECLETQCRRTLRTRLVAALRMMNSLSHVRSELLNPAQKQTHTGVNGGGENENTVGVTSVNWRLVEYFCAIKGKAPGLSQVAKCECLDQRNSAAPVEHGLAHRNTDSSWGQHSALGRWRIIACAIKFQGLPSAWKK